MSIWVPMLQQLIHNLGGDTIFHWLNTVLGLLGGGNGGHAGDLGGLLGGNGGNGGLF